MIISIIFNGIKNNQTIFVVKKLDEEISRRVIIGSSSIGSPKSLNKALISGMIVNSNTQKIIDMAPAKIPI
ncbi:hypothetical protein GF362_05100 [Candidatus Dojkabacteria bacterium]|nr:hypothetical protein [Candidatus Dojkabacteria bacterium]